MAKRWFPTGVVLAAVLGLWLLVPEKSAGQFRRGGGGVNLGGVGFSTGTGGLYRYGPGYAPGYRGWNPGFYGPTAYPRYPSYGWGAAPESFQDYPRGWYGPRSYEFNRYPPGNFFYGQPAGSYGPYSPDALRRYEDGGRSDRTVLIDLRVPAEAEVWFEGVRTGQTGPSRQFQSPPLEPGHSYTYKVRARWLEDGQEVDQTRKVKVQAGQQVWVDFTQPSEPTAAPAER